MAEKIRRVRRRGKVRLFSNLESFMRRQLWPARLALVIGASALAVALGIISLNYGSKLYRGWHETRLLHGAAAMLQEEKFTQATQNAREVLQLHPDSLPAFQILAEAAEKQNLEETVSWRAQTARLLPNDPASQLNLASAALRFGQLDVARKALDHVSPADRDTAAFHVAAGWLARAEGNFAEQEEQFAAAVKKEPSSDLYQFNLAAIQIHSADPKKSANARATLDRLSKLAPFRTGALRALLIMQLRCGNRAKPRRRPKHSGVPPSKRQTNSRSANLILRVLLRNGISRKNPNNSGCRLRKIRQCGVRRWTHWPGFIAQTMKLGNFMISSSASTKVLPTSRRSLRTARDSV